MGDFLKGDFIFNDRQGIQRDESVQTIDEKADGRPAQSQVYAASSPWNWIRFCFICLTVVALLRVVGTSLWTAHPWSHLLRNSRRDTKLSGTTPHGHYSHVRQIETLAASHIPGGQTDPQGNKRLIFVGDIHGCRSQCETHQRE